MEGNLKAAGASHGFEHPLTSAAAGGWLGLLGAAGLVTIGYLLAARLGLALLLAHSDVAVFWPASGLAAGILIVLGPHARPSVVIGVVVGTIAAGLLGHRELLTSIFTNYLLWLSILIVGNAPARFDPADLSIVVPAMCKSTGRTLC
jgi:hypothetical protein